MRKLNIIISGFGTVGRSFVKLLVNKKDKLIDRYGIDINVIGITDSRGGVLKTEGFKERELLELLKVPRGSVCQFKPYGSPGYTTVNMLEDLSPDVLIEVTPSNYINGMPGIEHVRRAINLGVHIVLSNKAPLALSFSEIMKSAVKRGVQIKYKATVMAGTPLIDLLIHGLNVQEVYEIRGILNGTTNFILSLMHSKGLDFKEALRVAQKKGIAEANPTLDIEGWDPAAKLAIIVNTLLGINSNYTVYNVERKPLWPYVEEAMKKLDKKKAVLKYIAVAKIENEEAKVLRVEPKVIPLQDPLASVNDTYNGVVMHIEPKNEIFIKGKGAGGPETALVLLSDILEIALST